MMMSKLLATLAVFLGCGFIALPAWAQQQLIQIRYYHFNSSAKAEKFDEMVETAALPLLEKLDVGPVGVFEVVDSPVLDRQTRVTITAYDSMEQLLKVRRTFAEDGTFLANAASYLEQEKGDPAYDRVEAMLLLAFDGMPSLRVPERSDETPRVFELRTYKSENEVQQALKVKMFNEGEMDIFKKVGLKAVFYGDALVAPDLPQLTYMLVHDNKEAQDKAWRSFIDSPEWKSLNGEEQYQVIKLKITRHMLAPTKYSQIQ